MLFSAAFTLGLLGSLHCAGMCGPIALAIPVRSGSRTGLFGGSLLYNAGRAVAYGFLGLLFGLLGQGVAMAGWQSALSVVIGSLLLLHLLLPRVVRIRTGFLYRINQRVIAGIRKLFSNGSPQALLLLGFLNGFLPCGLVYVAIAGAVATGNAWQGAAFMMIFGLGTWPAMMALTMVRDYIGLRFRKYVLNIVPVFIGAMALMLILRGMNLGIPYLSPKIENSGGTCQHRCCAGN